MRNSTRTDISHPDLSLNEKGQCPYCGRKPIAYRAYHFCTRCDRAYAVGSVDDGKQIENWAWKKREDGQWVRVPRISARHR